MIPAERRARLMKLLNENVYVQVADIAAEFEISPITIRRDLLELEQEGICTRKRGGAVLNSQENAMELPYSIKQIQNVPIKKRIAEAALNFIEDGNSIILDSGTTTFALAQRLITRRRLSVVTNDLQIASKLATNPNINLICTGGIVRTNVFSLQGSIAESSVSNICVDITFLGADAIHPNRGIYNVNIEEVPIKQMMIKSASKVILLTDSSKFNLCGFAKVCDMSQIDIFITDNKIDLEIKDYIQAKIKKELILV